MCANDPVDDVGDILVDIGRPGIGAVRRRARGDLRGGRVGEVDREVVGRPRAVEIVGELREATRLTRAVGVGRVRAIAARQRRALAEIIVAERRKDADSGDAYIWGGGLRCACWP